LWVAVTAPHVISTASTVELKLNKQSRMLHLIPHFALQCMELAMHTPTPLSPQRPPYAYVPELGLNLAASLRQHRAVSA
jgi:hypothetical protein